MKKPIITQRDAYKMLEIINGIMLLTDEAPETFKAGTLKAPLLYMNGKKNG